MNKPTNPKDTVAIGKVSMSVLPANVMLEVATAMMEGACKYGRHNYRSAGVRSSIYYDATMRHLTAWWEGEDIDDVSSLSHITKAISSLVVLRDAMLNDMLTDDRPPRPKVQIGKHIEALNEICASLIERHKGADVTHYTEVDRVVQTIDLEVQAKGSVDHTHCSACGVPAGEDHRPNCEVLQHRNQAWLDGQQRMNNIARSHGDGEHYDEVQPTPTFDESANFDPIASTLDMSDPTRWRDGDVIECVYAEASSRAFTKGKLYTVKGQPEAMSVSVREDDSGSTTYGWLPKHFRWHSRPTPGAKP